MRRRKPALAQPHGGMQYAVGQRRQTGSRLVHTRKAVQVAGAEAQQVSLREARQHAGRLRIVRPPFQRAIQLFREGGR